MATPAKENPYQTLIDSCNNDPLTIQKIYDAHRTTRSQLQTTKFLAPDFLGVEPDQVLYAREQEGVEDVRNCLVFWARPTAAVKEIVGEVQTRLTEVVSDLYCPSSEHLHMTALEITHSRTPEEIEELVEMSMPQVEEMVNLLKAKGGVRLQNPMVAFDTQGLALTFLPNPDDVYGYHHLRRDLWSLAAQSVEIGSRYVVPSAHITVGRFLGKKVDVRKFVRAVEEVNEWLKGREMEWRVGEEVGLCMRKGVLWYGDGGVDVRVGEGI